jgi:hypothetical protein
MDELELFMCTFASRRDDFALQRSDGGYVRAGRALSLQEVHAHLAGTQTIGSYVIDERGYCSYTVFDADREQDLHILQGVQVRLGADGIPSYLEQSRRGGHLWVFLAQLVRASCVRAWLLPYCPEQIEFYPKQDEGRGYGSLIRLPFGVHRLSGKRYFFVEWTQAPLRPVADSVEGSLLWLASIQRATYEPPSPRLAPPISTHYSRQQEKSFSSPYAQTTIRGWCASQNPYGVIGHYVALNVRGVGCCPFGWHHENGRDRHASFKVYRPGVPGGYCWYCYVWQQGGSVFDFLRYHFNLDAHTMWGRIQRGEV